MSLENHKITTYQDNVKDLPDYPSDAGITAIQLKNIFDGRTDKEIKEKFNGLIDELKEMFESAAEETEKAEQNANAFAGELVNSHNAATDAHADIRTIIAELSRRLSAIADSDDVTLDQLSEIVAYIKDNREIIEVITQDKANADDVYDRETVDALLDGKVGEEELKSELEGYVKGTDYATADKAGVVKINKSLGKSGLWITEEGQLSIFEAHPIDIDAKQSMAVITCANVEYAISKFGADYFASSEDIGDISAALDAILAIQNELIGGDSE
jgi:hypothetical protein